MGANVPTGSAVDAPVVMVDPSQTRPAFVSVEKARCFVSPEIGFDRIIARLDYGDRVGVRRLEDGFAEVIYADTYGWIPVEELSDDESAIFPRLAAGYRYGSAHEETRKLRRAIRDECAGDELGLSLQSIEYVLYELKRRRIEVRWPLARPRVPGSLHMLLRGRANVRIGIEPRTSALLEVSTGPTEGFFGIVEAVQPDQGITLSSVGRVEEGEFRREHFTKEEWREWRPTFISFG